MSIKRRVGLIRGLRYKGGGPMWSWILHRITGLSILVFVSLHVVASFFMHLVGSDWAVDLNIIYESWIFQIYMTFVVIFHAVNGLRIAVLDIWPKLIQYQREVIWLEWMIIVPVYGLIVFIIIQTGLAGV